MRITTPDLLQALAEASRGERLSVEDVVRGEKAATVEELAQVMGCGVARVRKALKALAAQGRLEVLSRRRASISGKPILIPAYRVKEKRPKAKAGGR